MKTAGQEKKRLVFKPHSAEATVMNRDDRTASLMLSGLNKGVFCVMLRKKNCIKEASHYKILNAAMYLI